MGFNRSDIKVSFVNDGTRFYVNEEKGTVVCSVEAYLLVPTNRKYLRNTANIFVCLQADYR